MADIDLERLDAAVRSQHDLLVAVAEAVVTADEADPDYRRQHAELGTILRPTGVPCFCFWDSVWGWWSEALAAGDPEWRERLLALEARNLALLGGLPEKPKKYDLRPYVSGGKVPFSTGFAQLADDQKVALRRGLKDQLAMLGPLITKDQRMGRWITREKTGARILEYKVQADASDLPAENPDGTPRDSGYPKRAIEIRVFCCMSADDSAVVIFNTYDKGGDPSDKRQEREIDRAFKLLNEYRIAEARAKKAAARGRSA